MKDVLSKLLEVEEGLALLSTKADSAQRFLTWPPEEMRNCVVKQKKKR